MNHAAAALVCLAGLLGPAASLIAADQVEVEVTGVEGAALNNVRGALALPPGLVQNGAVDRLWLGRFRDQAAERTRSALEPYGYYHAQASATVEEPGNGSFRVHVAVRPGDPVLLTEVDVALAGPGSGEAALRRLVSMFPLVKGGVLLQVDYERAKADLQFRAVALGYLDADFTRHEIRIAPGERAARVALTLQTGERFFFGDTRIEGATDYPQPYLRRFLTFKKGEVFSYAKLGETQLNYVNSERFRDIAIAPESRPADSLQVPVLVSLASVPRRSLRPGVGYGTDTGARISVRYRDMNLFREGHDLDVNLYAAQRLQGFATRYTWPSTRNLKSSTSLQLNLQQQNVTTYDSRLAALELARNHGFGKGELGAVYLKFQMEDFTVAGTNSGSRLVLPGLRFSKERFDNPARPGKGYAIMFDVRGAHPYLGSDSSLAQGIVGGDFLAPLPGRLSLHLRAKAGATVLGDPLSDIPPSIRFYAGGDQSVRGYSYQSLGPRDAKGNIVGGKNLLVGSVELERALGRDFGVSLFYDVGNAFNDFADPQLAQGAGVGLHYYTQVGALNLSLAKPFGAGRSGYHVHFTVGFQL